MAPFLELRKPWLVLGAIEVDFHVPIGQNVMLGARTAERVTDFNVTSVGVCFWFC